MKHDFIADKEREKRLLAMGQMAASLAHEIRNPLGSMELFCSLLKKDLVEQPQLHTLAEQIHTGIRTVNHIISNCLQFAREIVANRREVRDVQDYLKNAVMNLQAKAQESEVAIVISVKGEGQLFIDHFQIKQVIINLVSNAIDAVADRFSRGVIEGERKEVLVESDLSDPNMWLLCVVDNGVGISEDVKKNIFEPFYSTKEEGTGLGLAVVHSIVSAHQGSIAIQNNEGPGCSVCMKIPRCKQGEIQ